MTRKIEPPRKRTINLVIGIVLATLHAAAPVNFLKNNQRFESFLGTPLMTAGVRTAWLASSLALMATIAVLVLVKRKTNFPSVLLMLIGNYLCPAVFGMIFHPLFHDVLNLYPAGVSNSELILAELLMLNAYDCIVGLLVGLTLSGLATLVTSSPGGQQLEDK